MKRTEAHLIRSRLEQAAQHIPEIEAYDVIWMYPQWTEDGQYTAGKVWEYGGKLWRCRQDHQGQPGYEPSPSTAALWELIPMPGEEGTKDNPIAYSIGMALSEGLYYTEDGVEYLCTRDTGIPVYVSLSALVGQFVEVVDDD